MSKTRFTTVFLLIFFMGPGTSLPCAAIAPEDRLIEKIQARRERASQNARERLRDFTLFVKQYKNKELNPDQANIAQNYFYQRALHLLSAGAGRAQLIWIQAGARSGATSLMQWMAAFEPDRRYRHLHLYESYLVGPMINDVLAATKDSHVIVLDDISQDLFRDENLILQLADIGGGRVIVFIDSQAAASRLSLIEYSRIRLVDSFPSTGCRTHLLQ